MSNLSGIPLYNNTPPIIIIHNGYSEYAQICINQAAYNYNGQIVLISNGTEGMERNFSSINIKNFSAAGDLFRREYRHISVNSSDYECFCFERWFLLRDVMAINKIDRAVAMDSDVLIYAGVHETIGRLANYNFSSWTHFAILELSTLVDFCNFVLDIYTKSGHLDLFAEHRRVKKSLKIAHLSDMDFFEEYALNCANSINMNVAFMSLGVDPNISLSHGCKMDGDIKQIHWLHRNPTIFEISSRINYPLSSLHLQGSSKKYAGKLLSYPKMSELTLLDQAMLKVE